MASSLPRRRLTAAAKADFGNKPLIAALNRCATQNQNAKLGFSANFKAARLQRTVL
jgi:hypothetical protein